MRIEGLVHELAGQFDDDQFRAAYPDAYDKWQAAHELLHVDGAIRLVLEARAESVGQTVGAFPLSLCDHWAVVNDRVQRQVHKSGREREALTAEESRRLVFQTMLVMYEIHAALTR